MSDWPPEDCDPAVYEVPYVRPPASPPLERRAWLAGERVRRGLPVSDAIIDELTELQRHRDGIYISDAERDAALSRAQARVVFSEEQTAALMDQLKADHELLTEQGIRLDMYGPDPEHGLHIRFRGWDAAEGERLLHERYGDGIRVEYAGAAARLLRPFPFGSWLAEGDRLHVFYGLPLNGERPLGAQAIERDDSVIVGLRIDAGYRSRLVGGFTRSHATVQLAAPLGNRVVVDDSANRVRPHWTEVPPSPHRPGGPGRERG